MKVPGPGGQTRSFMIHEKLWNYLQDMITRMFWGQEQFGGGFCGAGERRLGQTNAIKGGLRTLGTIERYAFAPNLDINALTGFNKFVAAK